MLKISLGHKTTQVCKIAIHDMRLSGKDLNVLSAIKECADNNTGIANVSLATICELSRSSNKTVYASISTLEEYGYISKENRVTNKGKVANRYTVAKDVEVPVEDMSTYMKSKVEEFCEVNNVEEGVIDFSGRISDMSVKEEVKEEPVEKVKPVKKKPVLKKVKKSTPKTTPKIGREVGSTNNEPMRLVNKYKTTTPKTTTPKTTTPETPKRSKSAITTTTTRRGLITVTHSINRNISKVIDGVECVQHTITTTFDSGEEPVTNIYMEPVDWKSWSEYSMEERKKFFKMGIKRRN